MKRAATPWFSKIVDDSFDIIYDYSQIVDYDIFAIEFHDADYNGHLSLIEHMQSNVDHFVVVETEPVSNDLNESGFLDYLDRLPKNVTLFSDTVLNQPRENCRTAISWFTTNTNYYQKSVWPHREEWRRNMLAAVDSPPFMGREFMVDCLLGTKKSHRDLVESLYAASEFKDKIIHTYIGNDIKLGSWPPGLDRSDLPAEFTAGQVRYQGVELPLSAILPFDIYNQSYFSLVAETTCNNNYSHFTEKIAKPIIARRPFVVFAGQHYLKNLRSLGFRTFSPVIDESYDSIADPEQRFRAAWKEVEFLCQPIQDRIYASLKRILDHNRQHFLETDWYADLKSVLHQ